MFGIFKVQGDSMYPSLSAGDFVVTCRFYRKLAIGDLVVFKHKNYGRLIKRIADVASSGALRLAGENDASVNSQQIGWVAKHDLLGLVLFKIRR
ncbi:MAG: peptidase S24 [Methylophaga sp.]|nr:MAG: peptidase S24 [Methylophaga sp.]